MSSAEDVATLDARWGIKDWGLWRLAMGGRWQVQLGRPRDGTGWTADGDTPEEALAAAVASGPPLPVVPRPPTVILRDALTVERDGSKWCVLHQGRSCGLHNLATKTSAVAAADVFAARTVTDRAEWEAGYGPVVNGKVEGVDFHWRPW